MAHGYDVKLLLVFNRNGFTDRKEKNETNRRTKIPHVNRIKKIASPVVNDLVPILRTLQISVLTPDWNI